MRQRLSSALALLLWLVWPLLAAGQQSAVSTGTITAANGAVMLSQALNKGSGTVQVTGTWTGTLRLQCKVGTAALATIALAPAGGGAAVTSTTGNGTWLFFGAFDYCEVNESSGSWTGTATVNGLVTNAHVPPSLATTGAASSAASYLTATAEAGLSAEVNLGALTTGVLYETVSAGTATPATIACTSGLLQGGAPPTCTTTPALGTPASGVATNLTGTAAGLTAGAASALAADPADCAAGTVALGINAAGTAQCTATPSVTSLQGILGNVTPAAATVTTAVASSAIVGNAASVATIAARLTATNNTAALPSWQNSANEVWLIQAAGANDTAPVIGVSSYGTGAAGAFSVVDFQRARGTAASPTALLAGDLVGVLGSIGYTASGTTGYSGGFAQIRTYAAENFSATNQGGAMAFLVTPLGAVAATGNVELMRLQDGRVTISPNTNGGANTPPTLPAPSAGTLLHLASSDSVIPISLLDSYGDAFGNTVLPVRQFRTARGTAAAPTAVQSGDYLGALTGSGRAATGYSGGVGQVRFVALQTFTDSAQGTAVEFWTTPTGSTTPVSAVRVAAGLMVGSLVDPGTGKIALRDTGAAFDLVLAATGTGASAARTLTLDTVNASRTVKLGGNVTTAGDLITSGANSLTFTTTGGTSVTLPTSGTLVNSAVTALSSLTTTSTMTSGTLGIGYVIAGVTMTLGSDATGDIYYRNSSGVLTRLGIGSSSTVLVGGTIPAWSGSPTLTGGSLTGLTTLAIRDTSAAFDLTVAATSTSGTLTAGRALTLDVGNVAHTLVFGTTANTITFPNAASGTVPLLNLAQTWTATQTFLQITITPSADSTKLVMNDTNANAASRNYQWRTSLNAFGDITLMRSATQGGAPESGSVVGGWGPAGGFYTAAATGTDKGSGTINAAGAYYANGTVGVTQTSAAVTALATIGGIVTTFTPVSDERLKDWAPYTRGLAELRRLQSIRYTWNAVALEHDPGLSQFGELYGWRAQNLQEIAPEVVGVDRWADGRTWLTQRSDRAITAMTVTAVQELDAEVVWLKAENTRRQLDLETLTGRLDALESRRN